MKPENLTIKRLEKESRLPAEQWHGKCTALAAVACRLVGGHEIYGDYLGPVHKDGFWGERRMLPNHHGWVLLEDGRILDPTRWSFENVEPYIYLDFNDKEYDEGGNVKRGMFRQPCPKPKGPLANLTPSLCAETLFEHLTQTPFEKMSREQAFWVANLGYDELGFAVAGIYQTLIDNDMDAAIPLDNKERAEREGRINGDG